MQKSNLITFNQRVTNIWGYGWLFFACAVIAIVGASVHQVKQGLSIDIAIEGGLTILLIVGLTMLSIVLWLESRATRRYLNDSAGSRR